jgi:hypothetical protein
MTDPRDTHSRSGARSDRDPEVNPEVIQDLDAPMEDADDIRGGKCRVDAATTNPSGTQN